MPRNIRLWYGVVKTKLKSGSDKNNVFLTEIKWGRTPFNIRRLVVLGTVKDRKKRYVDPLNAHLRAIELLQETEDFTALKKAVDVCLNDNSSPLKFLNERGENVFTPQQQLQLCVCLYTAVLKFWVLMPDHANSLPWLAEGMRMGGFKGKWPEPVGVSSDLDGPVYVDGYFGNSSDRAVRRAFSVVGVSNEVDNLPRGKFHATVISERAIMRLEDIKELARSNRFTQNPLSANPGGFQPLRGARFTTDCPGRLYYLLI
jgi:hypothetical protein